MWPTLDTDARVWLRWTFLLSVLGLEFFGLRGLYAVPSLHTPAPSFVAALGWPVLLFHFSTEIWKIAAWVVAALIVVISPRIRSISLEMLRQAVGHRWKVGFASHLLTFALMAGVTHEVLGKPGDPGHLSAPWCVAWFALACTTLLSWMTAFAPRRMWLKLVRQERWTLVIAVVLGIGGWFLLRMLARQEAPLAQRELWNALAASTLWLSHLLVRSIYSDTVYQPESSIVGTNAFHVEIGYPCSGIEGISLITCFLALYLWLFRKELRFPQVFCLFPLGIATIWVSNAVRIAALVAIGTSWSPNVALEGFHAQAGWIAFTVIAVCVIALAHRWRFFAVANAGETDGRHDTLPAAALLVPLLVQLAVSMITSAAASGFDLLYPVRVAATLGALYYFRSSYREWAWRGSWHPVAIGVIVFVAWMLLETGADQTASTTAAELDKLPRWAASAWVGARILGSTLAVPLAEELAFRGYLIRKLVAEDFENVSFRKFTWLSFVLSSLLFGLLHGERWFAATLAGMGFALALQRRGRLVDAVIAHITANALICVVVLTQNRWELWS